MKEKLGEAYEDVRSLDSFKPFSTEGLGRSGDRQSFSQLTYEHLQNRSSNEYNVNLVTDQDTS